MADEARKERVPAAHGDESDLDTDVLADFTTNIIDYMERRRPQIRLDESLPTTPTRHSSHSSTDRLQHEEVPEMFPYSPKDTHSRPQEQAEKTDNHKMAEMKLQLDRIVQKLDTQQNEWKDRINTRQARRDSQGSTGEGEQEDDSASTLFSSKKTKNGSTEPAHSVTVEKVAEINLRLDQLMQKLNVDDEERQQQNIDELRQLSADLKDTRTDLAKMDLVSQQTNGSLTQVGADLQKTREDLAQMATEYQDARQDLAQMTSDYQETRTALTTALKEYQKMHEQSIQKAEDHQQVHAELTRSRNAEEDLRARLKETTVEERQARIELARISVDLEQARTRLTKVVKERTFYKKESFRMMEERNQAQRQLAKVTADRDLYKHLYMQENGQSSSHNENNRPERKNVTFEGSDEDYTCLMVEMPIKGRSRLV